MRYPILKCKKVAYLAIYSSYWPFRGFLGRFSITVDREVVEKINIFICTSHTILMNPFKVIIQNIMMLRLFILVPEGLLSGCYRAYLYGMLFGVHSGRPMYILHRPLWNQFVSS